MARLLKFDCPRCSREYSLSMNLAVAKQTRQRAQCARCGERFEIVPRIIAQQAEAENAITEFSNNPWHTVANAQISTRLAEALLASDHQRDAESAPSDKAITHPTGDAIIKSSLSSGDENQSPPQEESLPQSLDWLAYAGSHVKSLHRDPETRERELATLLNLPM